MSRQYIVYVIKVFSPHIVGIIGFILSLLVVAEVTKYKLLLVILTIPIYCLLFLVLVSLIPNSWLIAKPTVDQDADTAIVLGFGYEVFKEEMLPGKANEALLEWTLNNGSPQINLLLLQEGVWVAVEEDVLERFGIERKKIHKHDPNIYVNTLDTAYCAIRQLQTLDRKKVILIAHDLQLQRVAWDFERVSKRICSDCIFVIPPIHDIAYPANSVHWQTRSEFFYKIVEVLLARPRDFLSPVPNECKAPF